MIKKTITYENFAGDQVTKDFWFHLSKVDGFELSLDGTFEAKMRKAIQDQDKLTVFREFKKLIAAAVGVRSENGEDFSKPEAFRDSFMNSPAFDELIMDLFSDESKAAEFMAALFPKGVQAAMKEQGYPAKAGDVITIDPFKEEPSWVTARRVPSKEEFAAATPEQKMLAFQLQSEAKGS